MTQSTAYSFTQQKTVTITNIAQLDDLTEERRKRGCSESELENFRRWHLAKIEQQ